MRPLSTPSSPTFSPSSSIETPSTTLPSSSRIGTSSAWTPCSSPATWSCANPAELGREAEHGAALRGELPRPLHHVLAVLGGGEPAGMAEARPRHDLAHALANLGVLAIEEPLQPVHAAYLPRCARMTT